jgi:hypothetical protein
MGRNARTFKTTYLLLRSTEFDLSTRMTELRKLRKRIAKLQRLQLADVKLLPRLDQRSHSNSSN